MKLRKNDEFGKIIKIGICLFLFHSCSKKPSEIITISNEEIGNMLPANFKVHNEIQKISINDTIKLSYLQNQFLMKNQMSNDEKEYIIFSDTISKRILRKFQALEIKADKFLIKFDMIDLESDEIPSIFGGNKNKNFVSRPFRLVSHQKNYLTKAEKDSLEKSLFTAFQ